MTEGSDKELVMPVSYTHLDVYKRQADSHVVERKALCVYVCLRSGELFVKLVSQCEHSRIRSLFKFLVPPGPVSYTHLDVYKRQT